jgi:hypothetical protein
MGRLHFVESEAVEAHGPLRAIPAEEVFQDETPNWIDPPPSPIPAVPGTQTYPSSPSYPSTQPYPMPPSPLPKPSSTDTPPPPPAGIPEPDPSLSQARSSRQKAIDEDVFKDNEISQAGWSVPAKPKPQKSLFKRSTKTGESN